MSPCLPGIDPQRSANPLEGGFAIAQLMRQDPEQVPCVRLVRFAFQDTLIGGFRLRQFALPVKRDRLLQIRIGNAGTAMQHQRDVCFLRNSGQSGKI